MVKQTGRGLVVKRPGVRTKVHMLNLVLVVGARVFSLLPKSFETGLTSQTLKTLNSLIKEVKVGLLN